SPRRPGAVPGRPLQQEGRSRPGLPATSGAMPGASPNGAPDDRHTAQPRRDERSQREGQRGTTGSPPATSGAAGNIRPNGTPGALRDVGPRRDQPDNLGPGRSATPPATSGAAAPNAQHAPDNLRNARPGSEQRGDVREGGPETHAAPPNTQAARPPQAQRGPSEAFPPGREGGDERAGRRGSGAGADLPSTTG